MDLEDKDQDKVQGKDGPSEFERLLDAIRPLIQPVEPAELSDKDVDFLAGETGLPAAYILTAVNVSRWMRQMDEGKDPNIDAYLKQVSEGKDPVGDGSLTDQLKAFQRVYQVVPRDDAITALMAAGLTSALDICEVPADVFVDRFSKWLDKDDALRIHRDALCVVKTGSRCPD